MSRRQPRASTEPEPRYSDILLGFVMIVLVIAVSVWIVRAVGAEDVRAIKLQMPMDCEE